MTEETPVRRGKGTVFIRVEVCKGCAYCTEFCPTHCLELSREYNAKGYHFPVLVRPEDCTGCDLCGLYCPDFAIFAKRFKDIEQLRAGRAPSGEGRAKP